MTLDELRDKVRRDLLYWAERAKLDDFEPWVVTALVHLSDDADERLANVSRPAKRMVPGD